MTARALSHHRYLTNIMTQEEAGKLPDYVAASAPDAARDDGV
ncbi:MAG: hypothetical protein ACLS3M_05595 [Collinsella sp.]